MTNNTPHDGTVNSFAVQLMFIDAAIRQKLVDLQKHQQTHTIIDKLPRENRHRALGVLGEIVRQPRRPINHELRQLLAVALEIECPDIHDIPRILIHMREYPTAGIA